MSVCRTVRVLWGNPMASRRSTAVIAAWLCVLIWGTTFVSTKVLLADLGPVGILLIRTALGTAALYVLGRGRLPKMPRRSELLFAAAGLTGVCMYFVLENIALVYTTASNVSVIVSVSPLLTGLLAWPVLQTGRPLWNFFGGFAAAIVGIWLISGEGSMEGSGIAGDMLSIAAAACWAVYSIHVRKIGELKLPLLLVTRRIFVYGLLFLLFAFWLSGERIETGVFRSVSGILNLLFLGLGASAFCFFAWNYAVGVLGPVQTTAFLYAVPVITVVFAALILHETIAPAGYAGIALTLLGMVTAQRQPKRRE